MSLITQLNDVMARRGFTQTHVARAIGRSSAVINQYLQGKYQAIWLILKNAFLPL